MAVKILGEGEALPTPKNIADPQSPAGPEVKVDQFEVFGRLDMSYAQIAAYYGITKNQVVTLFTKKPIRDAYDRGKAEVIIAVRQKQLQVAFGLTDDNGKQLTAPHPQMLIYVGQQFAEQERDPEFSREDAAPNRFSWDNEMKRRIDAVRAKIKPEDE